MKEERIQKSEKKKKKKTGAEKSRTIRRELEYGEYGQGGGSQFGGGGDRDERRQASGIAGQLRGGFKKRGSFDRR